MPQKQTRMIEVPETIGNRKMMLTMRITDKVAPYDPSSDEQRYPDFKKRTDSRVFANTCVHRTVEIVKVRPLGGNYD